MADARPKLVSMAKAERAIVAEWLALPVAKQTRDSVVPFALKAARRYVFQYPGDPYPVIKGWLTSRLPRLQR